MKHADEKRVKNTQRKTKWRIKFFFLKDPRRFFGSMQRMSAKKRDILSGMGYFFLKPFLNRTKDNI